METIRIIPSHEVHVIGPVDAIYEQERRPHSVSDFLTPINKLLPSFDLHNVKDIFYLTTMSKSSRRCDNHVVDMSKNFKVNCGKCDVCYAQSIGCYRYLVNPNIHIFVNTQCHHTCKTCKEMCAYCLSRLLKLCSDVSIKAYAKDLEAKQGKCQPSICANCLRRKICPHQKEQHCPKHMEQTDFNKFKTASFVQNGSYKTKPTAVCVECLYNDHKYFFSSYELPSISKAPVFKQMIVYGPDFTSKCQGDECSHLLPTGLNYCSTTCANI